MAVDNPVCANCGGNGSQVCGGCRLVLYCNGDCQKSHWAEHKQYCRSPLTKSTWEPDWMKEKRLPTFVEDASDGPCLSYFGELRYLWGTVPALDVIQLSANEGESYSSELPLLFAGRCIFDTTPPFETDLEAASGDLRNIIKSLTSLPTTYDGAVTSVINDADFVIVARNTIMLLVALSGDDDTQTTRIIIHLWYSAFIEKKDAEYLSRSVRPMVEDVVDQIASEKPDAVCGKTWTFENCTFRLELTKARWNMLLAYFDVPHGMTLEMARQIRQNTVLAPRKDSQELCLLHQPPYHRVAYQRFRKDGILAPFGYSRATFTVPNPTLFQGAAWPMLESAEPIAGWDLTDVRDSSAYGAGHDLYGKLYFHLQKLLTGFKTRLSQLNCHFRMLNVSVAELPNQLAGMSFARIETSNISNHGYRGIRSTIDILAPLLQSPGSNPHATLISLFTNATLQVDKSAADPRTPEAQIKEIGYHMECFYPGIFTKPATSTYDSTTMKMLVAKEVIRDLDRYFEEYMEWQQFELVERDFGVEMKERHTIVEKWPTKLKLRPEQPGAREEFESLISPGNTGNERYVEWKRTF